MPHLGARLAVRAEEEKQKSRVGKGKRPADSEIVGDERKQDVPKIAESHSAHRSAPDSSLNPAQIDGSENDLLRRGIQRLDGAVEPL